jgi:hypothetical protein
MTMAAPAISAAAIAAEIVTIRIPNLTVGDIFGVVARFSRY